MRILVAEDDAPLAGAFREELSREQFAVQTVSDGREAQRLAEDQSYDAVILDLDLAGVSSLELLRNIRSRKPDLPVLVTGSSLVEERVRGLDAGADDYVLKPFAFAELAARIRAVLRRGNRARASVLALADLTMDVLARTVDRGGHAIDLSPREFSLLEFLLRHAGQPVARNAIVENVWKMNHETMTNVVDVYINYLRRKIDNGRDSALIHTVRGVGYQIGGNGLSVH
jgi:two-component system, OmpR family, copper resistance phosphate regulon response regulator CusR